MPEITDPTELYFKDGIWAWVVNQWNHIIADGAGRLLISLDAQTLDIEVTQTEPADLTTGIHGWDPVAGDWVELLVDADGRLLVNVEDPVYAHYNTDAAQLIPNGGVHIVNFHNPVYDPDGLVTTGVAWKFTSAIPLYYHVSAALLFAATATWADGEIAEIGLYRNNALIEMLAFHDNNPAAATFKHLCGSTDIYLNAGDFIDIRVTQNSGAALNLSAWETYNYVAIHRI